MVVPSRVIFLLSEDFYDCGFVIHQGTSSAWL